MKYGIVYYTSKGFGSKRPSWDWYNNSFERNAHYQSLKERGFRVRKVQKKESKRIM